MVEFETKAPQKVRLAYCPCFNIEIWIVGNTNVCPHILFVGIQSLVLQKMSCSFRLTHISRCFKAIMFLTGFIFGSIVVYLICLEEGIFPLWANTVIAVSAGILFGLITLLVQYVGLFMLGKEKIKS